MGVGGPVFEKACGPRLIGVMPTVGAIAVVIGGCNRPRDKDEVMEDDELLFVEGSAACSNKFPSA